MITRTVEARIRAGWRGLSCPRRFAAGLLALGLTLSSGCAIVIEQGSEARDYVIIGYGRVRVPKAEATGANARLLEVSGVGVAISDVLRIGYFKEFEATLKPRTNSAVIVLRSDADHGRLEKLLKELNQKGLCLIIKDERS